MRMGRIAAVLAAAVLALAAAGCGDDNNNNSSGGSTTGGDSGKKALRVALLLPGAVSDQGYNADGKRAADEMKKELGADVTLTEAVAVPNQTDVYRQYASQGYDLVIGWGGQFTDGAVTTSAEFPDVKFLVVNSNAKNGSNLASMDTAIEQWQFFAGFLSAKLSKSGNVAWIGGQCFPATAANLHGSEQGAKYANPKVKFHSRFTGDFEDPTKAQTAAKAMIDQGADALTGNLNNGWPGVYQAAKQAGNLPIVTEWVDNHEQAPEVIASSVLKSQARFVVELAKKAQDGTLEGKFYKFDLPDDWGPIVADTDLLPDDLYKEALDVQKKVVSGEIKVAHDESCPK